MLPFVQEWNAAKHCATENPLPGTLLSDYVTRLCVAGDALAADYEKAVARANREAKAAVLLHNALAEAIGSEAASRICEEAFAAS